MIVISVTVEHYVSRAAPVILKWYMVLHELE